MASNTRPFFLCFTLAFSQLITAKHMHIWFVWRDNVKLQETLTVKVGAEKYKKCPIISTSNAPKVVCTMTGGAPSHCPPSIPAVNCFAVSIRKWLILFSLLLKIYLIYKSSFVHILTLDLWVVTLIYYKTIYYIFSEHELRCSSLDFESVVTMAWHAEGESIFTSIYFHSFRLYMLFC